MQLDNGLKLVIVQNNAIRSVAIGVFAKAGAVNERPEEAGISHLIEHMTFKGTNRRSVFDIVNEVASMGAQINAYTSRTHTCYYTLSRDAHATECLDVLADIYVNPLFAEDDLERERKVVFEEISESEDDPDDLCLENLLATFYEGHPLANLILGRKNTLSGLKSKDLKEYHGKFYIPENTVVSIAGNVTEKNAIKTVSEKFAAFSGTGDKLFKKLDTNNHHGTFAYAKKEIEQAHIAFAFPSAHYNTREAAVAGLISNVLGAEMSSRLFQSVREKLGLCYSIGSTCYTHENNGSFIIFTSVNPSNVQLAVKAIKNELVKLLKEGITVEELKKAKEQAKSSLVLGQESSSAMMRAFGRHVLITGELYDIDGRIDLVDSVTIDDVANMALKIINFDQMSASLVSPERVDVYEIIKNY